MGFHGPKHSDAHSPLSIHSLEYLAGLFFNRNWGEGTWTRDILGILEFQTTGPLGFVFFFVFLRIPGLCCMVLKVSQLGFAFSLSLFGFLLILWELHCQINYRQVGFQTYVVITDFMFGEAHYLPLWSADICRPANGTLSFFYFSTSDERHKTGTLLFLYKVLHARDNFTIGRRGMISTF